MKAYIGTSGYQYTEWNQTFYPAELRPDHYLGFYAQHLDSVEINNTFYRLPREQVLQAWAQQVAGHFRFSIKASQRITHQRLLSTDSIGDLEYLLTNTALLGDKLGAILFQTPSQLKPDMQRLEEFLHLFPPNVPAAFEFRNQSWRQDKTCKLLRDKNYAWCVTDTDHKDASIASTADWGYVRLRKSGYSEQHMRWWIEQIRSQPWNRVFVFFKHASQGPQSPLLARRFSDLWRQAQIREHREPAGQHH
ncbi:MAG: DUF72 domain-containing protein [Chitinivibrionales bacterium]